jgi:hypothetical protein
VNLQAYGISGVLDTLSPAELVGLVPYFIDRHPKEELVVIGAFGGEPRAWTTWPLPALEAADARRSLARDWASGEFDQLYLIGYSTRARQTCALINRLHGELTAEGTSTVHHNRSLVVNGQQWGYAGDGARVDASGNAGAVAVPDPGQGRAEGLLFRAACRKRYAAAQLRGLDPDQAAKAIRIATRCHADRAKVINPIRQADADESRYRSAMDKPFELSLKSAVALGIAATQNPDLAAEAMDDILDGRASAIDVWIEVARCSTGHERATAAALAAMAAWQEHAPSAVAFAEIALDADTESALAWAVWHLVGTRAAPEHVRPAVDHKEVAA